MHAGCSEVVSKLWKDLTQAAEFGKLVALRRKSLGFNQDDVAAAIGPNTNKSTISNIENGKTLSSPDTVNIVATKVGITRNELESLLNVATANSLLNPTPQNTDDVSLRAILEDLHIGTKDQLIALADKFEIERPSQYSVSELRDLLTKKAENTAPTGF